MNFTTVPGFIITLEQWSFRTPASLIKHSWHGKAKEKLRKIRGVDNIEQEFGDQIFANEISRRSKHPWRNLFQRKYRPQFCMAILIPFFQQLNAVQVIMVYSSIFFSTCGSGADQSRLFALVVVTVHVVTTLVSMYGINKWGRGFLLLKGGGQMLLCQLALLLCLALTAGNPSRLPEWFPIAILLCICIYVAAFAWSWVPNGWLILSEIFPLGIQSAAQSINVSANMIFRFAVAQTFLTMLCHLKFGIFIFFGYFLDSHDNIRLLVT